MSSQVSIVNGATLHNAGAITRTAAANTRSTDGGGTITNSSTGIISGDDLAV